MKDRDFLQARTAACSDILDGFRKRGQPLSETDQLAVQRALQILVESVIGMSRYVTEAVLGIRVGKSREGIDELRRALSWTGRSGVIRCRADDRRHPCDLMRLKKPC
jgi:uncharacterized protein YutE (UPF0331/DUF86 family)